MAKNLIEVVPESESLFINERTDAGFNSDRDLFCHELAHCISLVKQGRIDRLFKMNFGWEVFSDHWTLKMAENEATVFAYQWNLMDMLNLPDDGQILVPETRSAFLYVVCKEKSEGYFRELCDRRTQETKQDVLVLLQKTINLLVNHQQKCLEKT